MSALFSVAIFFAVIALAGMLFAVWVVFIIARGLMNGLGALLHRRQRPTPIIAIGSRCQTRGCQQLNPEGARFCRRCGRGLPGAHRVQVRRAAVW
jgi:hypothetical protein